MTVLVPFAPEHPKTRLASVLEPRERVAFAHAMLADVLDAIRATGREPTVLATEPPDIDRDVPVVVDDRDLSTAVNDRLDAASPATRDDQVGVVVADLALVTPASLERLFAADGDVVLAPGRGGGTNGVVVRDPAFRVDYHGVSYRDHARAAASVGADTTTVDSFRLAVDVDAPEDLVEVLLHGDGRGAAWLEGAGFAIESRDGRVRAVR